MNFFLLEHNLRNSRNVCPYRNQPKWFGNIIQNLILCSTEEIRLERHEGEEMMTEFISSNFPAV